MLNFEKVKLDELHNEISKYYQKLENKEGREDEN